MLYWLNVGGAAGAAAAARRGGRVGRAGAAGAAARLRPPVHVLPRARVPAVRRRAQGGLRLPAVRHARLPQAGLLPPARRRRGRAARDGVRRRHGHLPGGDVHVHRGDPRPPRLPLGQPLPRRLRRRGQGPQTRQAAVPEPGPAGAAAGAVAGAPVRPHQAHLGLAPRLALSRRAHARTRTHTHAHPRAPTRTHAHAHASQVVSTVIVTASEKFIRGVPLSNICITHANTEIRPNITIGPYYVFKNTIWNVPAILTHVYYKYIYLNTTFQSYLLNQMFYALRLIFMQF